ncbi:MAG: sigma-70 family RNA polymerase sigma factor [Gemmatimonadota bacterium]|nr:sigma-70 family RNA polymerase sigma factor [Gemmatimonadota bacterium]
MQPQPIRDQVAFERLVLPHLDRLLAFARRRVVAEADAEDLVQDAVVRAWDRFADLREPEHVRSWLYRIVRSLLADHHREKTRRRGLVSITRLEAAHERLVGSDDPSPLERVITLAAAERVHRALSLIPEEFAAAVELHDLFGLRYREVAEALDIPLGTVMSRISRGRKLLAGALAAEALESGGSDLAPELSPGRVERR